MERAQRLGIQDSVDKLVRDVIAFRVLEDVSHKPTAGSIYYRRGMPDKERLPDETVGVILTHLEHIGWSAAYKPKIRETCDMAKRGEDGSLIYDGSNKKQFFEHVFQLQPSI